MCSVSVYSQRDSKALCSWYHGGPRVRERWKRRAGARRFEPWPPSCPVCRCASCARWRTAGPLHCWRTVRCLKHQAQGASDGRRARRLAESEPEPLEAHLVVRCTTARAGWSWRAASCQSRRSAARPAASGEESAAAPRRCHRTSASSNASCVRPASQRQPVVGAVGARHHKRPRGRFGRAI